MHAAIVETDPVTAEIRILRYCVIHDCGNMINPMIVEGQVHGGVAQGVGGALYERMVYDESGQLLNASFMDFLMPYASEVPHIETDHLETPSPLNPLGIKGAGEAGCIPVTAVIASAISDAEGFAITSMPISPVELWELRQRHARGEIPSLARTRHTPAPPGSAPKRRPGGTMKISGTAALKASPQQVWDAFHDPEVLARCLPGCESLTEVGPDEYAMTVTAGVAAIKGTYEGKVALHRPQPPGQFTMKAQGCRRAGHGRRRRRGPPRALGRGWHRPEPTTPTRPSAG